MLTGRQTVDFHLFGKESMAEMNGSYLQHEGPTDVITFSYLDAVDPSFKDDNFTAGEIFVCPSVAAEAASAYGQSIDMEIVLYLVHGLLHLSGLDDQTDDDRLTMRQAESEVMEFIKDDVMSGPLFLLAE